MRCTTVCGPPPLKLSVQERVLLTLPRGLRQLHVLSCTFESTVQALACYPKEHCQRVTPQ